MICCRLSTEGADGETARQAHERAAQGGRGDAFCRYLPAAGGGAHRGLGDDVMYICEWCGLTFNEPDVLRRRENLDGERGVETQTILCCPFCGAEDIEVMKDEDADDIDAQDEPQGVA